MGEIILNRFGAEAIDRLAQGKSLTYSEVCFCGVFFRYLAENNHAGWDEVLSAIEKTLHNNNSTSDPNLILDSA